MDGSGDADQVPFFVCVLWELTARKYVMHDLSLTDLAVSLRDLTHISIAPEYVLPHLYPLRFLVKVHNSSHGEGSHPSGDESLIRRGVPMSLLNRGDSLQPFDDIIISQNIVQKKANILYLEYDIVIKPEQRFSVVVGYGSAGQ